MITRLFKAASAALTCFFFVTYTHGFTVTDDTGQTLAFKTTAKRIISLAPHITELLFSANAGAQIVGVVSHSDYPAAAKHIPQIGDYTRFDIERMIALAPDLIISWKSGNPKAQQDRLRLLKVPIFFSNPTTFSGIATTLQRFGKMTGHAHYSDKIAEQFMADIGRLKAQYQSTKSVRVFYEVWHEPILSINGKHLISRVIELCGGTNIFHELPSLVPSVALEAVLSRRPDVIMTSIDLNKTAAWQAKWMIFPTLPAVQNHMLFNLNADYLQRPTLRLRQGAKQLCQQLAQSRKKG